MSMKDMSMASSRIYVGNLGDNVDYDTLFEHFKPYGKIIGIKRPMKKSYGFIQFDSDVSAHEAITNEDQKNYHGRTLIVRAAVAGHNFSNKKDGSQTEGDLSGVNEASTGGPALLPNDSMLPEKIPERAPPLRGFRGENRYPPPPRPHSGFRDRSPLDGDWQEHGYDRYHPNEVYPVEPERNDCELIVVSKQLTEYAEYIEDRLKRMGLTVDLLFPNEDVPIGRVLGNILSRGSLYAILIMPQNEEHRSLTLNILIGLPQEHRNMPVDDALNLISRNYAELQRCGTTAGHEAAIALVNQLANGRSLTVVQYDRVIDYIKDCRDKQAKIEHGDVNSGNPSDKTQSDLQQRIMSILNNDNKDGNSSKPGQSSMSDMKGDTFDNNAARNQMDLRDRIASMLNTSTLAQGPAPQPVAAPNLKAAISNPSIQKALDSLLNKIN
ncbi:nuclear receptor coactivator protein neosin [Arctopsyche grandis]|uniref:nuclear receptor coactivator protein neosin n=1 Tax=Arctopsyche grandis TaxID=121162 RepID=UPI00406D9789